MGELQPLASIKHSYYSTYLLRFHSERVPCESNPPFPVLRNVLLQKLLDAFIVNKDQFWAL